jgi:ABC-type Fe3+/spermidine/putrescine transport system ATPase subunit
MDPVLELRQVSKHYPGHRAVSELSFAVPRGSLFALVGPSGCGKTTTLRLVAGFEAPTSGDIYLDGVRINDLKPYERNVSTVFQNYALFPHLTVRGNIEFGLRRKRAAGIEQRVRKLLELVRLEGKESRRISQISGGERQRVALARSLAVEPDVLLLDEPLSALDPKLRQQVRSELKSLQRRVGVTFVLVTHDQEEALSISDQIGVMHEGRLEQVGEPREVYLRPRTRFVASFLGAVNWVDGVGIRPEATRLTRERPPEGVGAIPATVRETLFLGNCVHVEAELAGGDVVVAELPRDDGFRRGERVQVWWRRADELRFPE